MKSNIIKKMSVLTVLILILAISFIGCTKKEVKQEEAKQESQDSALKTDENVKFEDESYIVKTDWLKDNLSNDKVLVLDARGEEAYNKGHIPGSVFVTWQQFSDVNGKPGDKNWGTVLEPKELSKKLSEIGITNDKKIVVYADTQKGWGEDGRIVWMLKSVGIQDSVILDGGFNYWESSGNEVSKETIKPTTSNFEVSVVDSKVNITTDELKEKLGKVKIIDVRAEKEYNGATDFGEPRGGHIPGAINIPFNKFLNEDGTLKNPADIKAILDENGINKDDEIVTYCTAGIRSAHMQVVLSMMGYENAKNYDQSFYAWAGNKDLELEK